MAEAEWEAVGVVIDGEQVNVDGINPWDYEWIRSEAPPVMLPHPAYPNQRHRMTIYEVLTDSGKIEFAAGELSASVWGFYSRKNRNP